MARLAEGARRIESNLGDHRPVRCGSPHALAVLFREFAADAPEGRFFLRFDVWVQRWGRLPRRDCAGLLPAWRRVFAGASSAHPGHSTFLPGEDEAFGVRRIGLLHATDAI